MVVTKAAMPNAWAANHVKVADRIGTVLTPKVAGGKIATVRAIRPEKETVLPIVAEEAAMVVVGTAIQKDTPELPEEGGLTDKLWINSNLYNGSKTPVFYFNIEYRAKFQGIPFLHFSHIDRTAEKPG